MEKPPSIVFRFVRRSSSVVCGLVLAVPFFACSNSGTAAPGEGSNAPAPESSSGAAAGTSGGGSSSGTTASSSSGTTGGSNTSAGNSNGSGVPNGTGGSSASTASGGSGGSTGGGSSSSGGGGSTGSSGSTTAAGSGGSNEGGTALTDGGLSIVVTGEGGSGCPGVPIVPDATGYVSAASNSLGIHGSFFTYSDCMDQKSTNGVNCSSVSPLPTAGAFPNVGGVMCTSGMTSTATGAWGAGVGLELNDGPPQMPYDTVANGVKGFCFVLSGTTIPSTSIRVAFPTKDNNDNAYFEAVTTPGMHTVLFSDPDFMQGSWVTTKTAFEPTLVTLMQFQIPSSTTAPVPWDFCIQGVTAVTQ